MGQPPDVWLLGVLCLTGLFLAVLPALTPWWAFAPSHDTPNLSTPLLCEVGRHFTAGRFPLFDWTMLEPVSHNAHFSPLYPFYFAGLVNYCELIPSVAAHDFVTVFHLGETQAGLLRLAWQRSEALWPVGGWVAFGAALYVAGFLVWMVVLSRNELTVVYPIAVGATLAISSLAAVLVLGESLNLLRLTGIACIMVGVVLVVRS